MSANNLEQLHEEHRNWLSELDLFQDEIRYFQNRLAEISADQYTDEYDEKIQEFKDRFIKTLVKIDTHRHVIRAYDKQVASRMELANRMKAGVEDIADHHSELDDIKKFEEGYLKLKKEFFEFLESTGKKASV